MNRQDIFDKVATHLLTQNKQAVDAMGQCQYRAADGCKCAVGCLIPDHLYTPLIENQGVYILVPHDASPPYNLCPAARRLKEILNEIGIADEDFPFVVSLQDVHDNPYDTTGWPSDLRDVAFEYGLSPAVVESFTVV